MINEEKWKPGRRNLYTLLFVLWSLAILVLSVIPSIESPLPGVTFLDKVAHFGQYLVFSILYFLMRSTQQKKDSLIFKELFILSLIVPVANELIQIPIPGRTFCLLDIVANFFGFLTVLLFLRRRTIRRSVVTQK